MEEHVAALHTATNALQALGRGFDVNFDTRLLYCKGVSGSRVVEIDEQYQRDLFLYDDIVVTNVSRDIRSSHESMGRQSSGVCSFQEAMEDIGGWFSALRHGQFQPIWWDFPPYSNMMARHGGQYGKILALRHGPPSTTLLS
ncbi:hypothetical protein TSUD_267570 [Trifolium subterraneum]|uniref:Uncharacterized protein n=1 Tax=Trifolium subterraneum TaxID=3900 RepID=A0A2Z6NLW4_TRISU|nr:hypothetical protein TSUD_267570 [Trifolium subterraneum]